MMLDATRTGATYRRTRRLAWLSLVISVVANAVLFAVLAYVNERFQGRAQDVVAKPLEIYVPPADYEPPPEPEQEEIEPEEPEPLEMQPLQTMQVQMPVMPRIPIDTNQIADPHALPVAVSDLPVSDVPHGPMDMPDVDRPPQRTYGSMPAYPHWARIRGLEAKLTVEFIVDEEGAVHDVHVRRLDGDERFRSLLIDAVKKWRFSPGEYRGQTVPVRCVQKLSFKLRG